MKFKEIEITILIFAPESMLRHGSDPRLGQRVFQGENNQILQDRVKSGLWVLVGGLQCKVEEDKIDFGNLLVSMRLPAENSQEEIEKLKAEGFKFNAAACERFGFTA